VATILSGAMLLETCTATEHTSLIVFHGIDDEVLPYNGNQDYQSVSDVVNFWLNHNNIPLSSLITTVLSGGATERKEYSGGRDNTDVVLYSITNEFNKPGGHVWFSEDIDGVHPNQILWDFLSSYRLDD